MTKNILTDTQKSLETTRSLHDAGLLHKKIVNRLRLMAALVLGGTAILIYDLAAGTFSFLPAIAIILPCFIVGVFMARMYKMDWSEEEELVIAGKMDSGSLAILAAYILFRIASRYLLDSVYTTASAAFAAGMAALVGIALGRLIGMAIIVERTYREARRSALEGK